MVKIATALLVFATFFAMAQSQPAAKLKLKVVTEHGRDEASWEIRSLIDEKGKDWKKALQPDLSADLPPGRYTIRIESFTNFPYQGTIDVRPPSTLSVIGLIFAGINNVTPAADISGKVLLKEIRPGDWCQLIGLYSTSRYFSPVEGDGSFTFRRANAGAYTFACHLGTATVGTRLLEFSAQGLPELVVQEDGNSTAR